MTPRPATDRDATVWPDHAYTPGQTPRHTAGAFAGIAATARAGADSEALMRCRAWRLGLRWAEAGYFWEAHELFEAVWAALPSQSRERRLVQAVIQIVNAGMKQRMGRPRAVARLAGMVRGLLDACGFEEEDTVAWVERAALEAWLAQIERGRLVNAGLTGASSPAIRTGGETAAGEQDADEIGPARL